MSCADCARRSHLLVSLGVPLDFCARDPARLWEALKLSDESLIDALGGRRREQLRSWHAGFRESAEQRSSASPERVCAHCEHYPDALRRIALAPRELHVTGGAHRLREALSCPVVALVGSRRCTDYGLEMARGLAFELGVTGLTMLSELGPGIPRSAQVGALEAKGTMVALSAGGLDGRPESLERARSRPFGGGLLLSELPNGTRSRRWSELARARTLTLLADLVIVVEAEAHPRELAAAHLASTLDKKLAAIPGRVTSTASEGANLLLYEGAALVRSARDALDVLYDASVGTRWPDGPPDMAPTPSELLLAADVERLDPRVREVLRMIRNGEDTVAKLLSTQRDGHAYLLELAELELRGLVRRGDGGRYVPSAIASYE